MDQKLLFMLKLNITTLLLVVQTALSVDSQFEACKPYNCGKGPNISYPFWIQGKQDSFCGYPGFQLSCINNEPIFNMSGNGYVIREIYHQNQSFLVTQASLQDNVCPSHISNLTLDRFPFTFGPAHVSVFIFFNCTHPLPTKYEGYSLNCTTGNVIHRSLALLRYDPMWNEVSGICNASVIVPIDKTESQNLDTLPYRNMIIHALRKGFLLKWNASSCSECNRSGGHCGFDFENFRFTCFCTDRPHLKSCKRRKKHTGKKIAIGVGTGAGVILMACIFYLIRHRRKLLSKSSALISRDITPDSSSKPDLENGGSYFQTPIFSYDELEEATNNFDSSKELGDGGFGTVYHGKLKDGRVVAVKRLYENNYKRVEQFMNEIAILSRLRHRNLVSLYGCTSRHSRELLLVYEFVPNGTVADHLHGERAKSGLLTWSIRMGIAIESADALSYLHASDTIHRDVKTNNILLDSNFHVKVADFGLSRLFPTDATHVSTAPQGTPGYVDPEYYQCYQLNDKSDVYSFGVVLIELISAKPAVDITRHRHEINLSNMAINKIHNDALHELVDPSLGFESNYNTKRMITMVAELAFRCLQQEKDMRPSMNEVLEALKEIENEQYKAEKEKAEEADLPADARLLKNIQPLSPNSVADKWVSNSTTPNTSA